jgi:signal transduction histidine kinase
MSTDERERPRRWRSWLGSIRVRSSLAAALVVAAAVGAAGLGLVYLARTTLVGNLEATATQRAGQITAAIRAGDSIMLAQTLKPSAGDQTMVQILDPAGHVLAASPALGGGAPITTLRPSDGEVAWQQVRLPSAGDDPFRILATGIDTGDGARIVVVVRSLEPVNETLEFLTGSVAAGTPILALVVGLATYFFVGRSLRPVEAIRRRVASITGRDRHARVPVPVARDEIAALAETMNAMLDRLQSAAEAQHRFVADASHELRSPLTTLQVGLDVLATNPSIPRVQLDRLHTEVARLSQLVIDLLLLARVDEHAPVARSAEVDLDDVAYTHRDRLHAQHPHLRVLTDLKPARVHGESGQLARVVGNLCDNAARHARGTVMVAVWADERHAHLTVADDGAGIEPADRQRVFDRFVRLDDSRTRADGGAGLGLAIVHEIVHNHGGTVAVEASDLGGAALHVALPLSTTDNAEATAISAVIRTGGPACVS